MITQNSPDQRAHFGFLGFLLGIASLVIILIQMSAYFEPQAKSSGTVIGEIAADIKQSAARKLAGQPAPEPPRETAPPPQDYGRIITVAALCMGGIAVVLGGVGLYRHEPRQLSYLAMSAGVSAFVMQYVFWLALLICGVVLLVTVIKNLDSITT